MFDNIDYECECPECGTGVGYFQSKDKGCLLDTLQPYEVDFFYSGCSKCTNRINFARVSPTIFEMEVYKWAEAGREVLWEHTKRVEIVDPHIKEQNDKMAVAQEVYEAFIEDGCHGEYVLGADLWERFDNLFKGQ